MTVQSQFLFMDNVSSVSADLLLICAIRDDRNLWALGGGSYPTTYRIPHGKQSAVREAF